MVNNNLFAGPAYSPDLSAATGNTIYIVDCGIGHSGTHKDIRAKYIVKEAVGKGVQRLHVITSGNSGMSLKDEIERQNAPLELSSIVSPDVSRAITRRLEGEKSRVIVTYLKRKRLGESDISALVGKGSWDVSYLEGPHYFGLVNAVLSVRPEIIAIPVGSGELFNSFYFFIREKGLGARLVGAVPEGNHPACALAKVNRARFIKRYTGKTRADKLAAAYISPAAESGIEDAVSKGHGILDFSEESIEWAVKASKEAGFDLEPSGAASLIVPKRYKGKRVVCVLTGKGKVGGAK